jgi:hypothetical protein
MSLTLGPKLGDKLGPKLGNKLVPKLFVEASILADAAVGVTRKRIEEWRRAMPSQRSTVRFSEISTSGDGIRWGTVGAIAF